jgi:hypothetical protein
MQCEGIDGKEARARQAASIAARRLGNPALHLDGGSYPALI